MTAIEGDNPVAAQPSPPAAERVPFGERLFDRLNPILGREVHQTLASRGFNVVMALALGSMIVVALIVAIGGDRFTEDGRSLLSWLLIVMAPVALLVLPSQVMSSMQHELREGAIDHLLMSQLSPRKIVRGKLATAAAMVTMVISAFAPMLAVTFLLRGIDVASIATCLLLALLSGIAAAAVGIAAGALSAWKPVQLLARGVATAAMAIATMGAMAGSWELVREIAWIIGNGRWEGVVVFAAACVVGSALMCMLAALVLTHPYENRSTPFRLFPLPVLALGWGLAWWMLPPTQMEDFSAVFAACAAVGCGLFGLCAVTESPGLSPRHRLLVPRNRLLALLAAPLLPGSNRGLLWTLAMLLLLLLLAYAMPQLRAGQWPRGIEETVMWLLISYSWIWVCIARLVRGSRPDGRRQAMLRVLLLFAAACALPAILDLVAQGEVRNWHGAHVLNPFWTMDSSRNMRHAQPVLAGLSLALLLVMVPRLIRGLFEVLEASRAPRA